MRNLFRNPIPKMAHGGHGVPNSLGRPPNKFGTPNAVFVLGGVKDHDLYSKKQDADYADERR
jgi:hypothetical protein